MSGSDKDLSINIRANNLASTSIRQLNTTLQELEYNLRRVVEGASASGQALTTAAKASIGIYEQEIALVKQAIAANREQAASVKAVTAAVNEQADALAVVHRTLQQNIDASFAVSADRQMKSASESARVLATSLSAAAEADARFRAGELASAEASAKAAAARVRQAEVYRETSGSAFFDTFNRRQGIGAGRTSAAASAAAFESALGPAGQGIKSVETRGTIDSVQGIGRAYLSAAESATVFKNALEPLGTGITSVATKGAIDTVQGIGRAYLSAAESAAVFNRELGPAGGGITSVATKGTIDTLHGIGQAYLSAKDSAKVFLETETAIEVEARVAAEALVAQAEALRANSVVQQMSGEAFFGAFSRRQGIGAGRNSAAGSAAAFSSALGPAGGGITTSSVQDTINRIHGLNNEFLSAAESAKVFAASMEPIGTGVVTAEIQATIDRIQGIGQKYLSAADSARVFIEAETAAETAARQAAVEQEAAAAAAERAASRARIRKLKEDAEGGGKLNLAGAAQHIVPLFDEAVSGRRGQMVATLGAAARDAGLSVGFLSASILALVAVMGTEKLLAGAEALGKLATQSRAAASASGMSLQSYSAMAGALTLVGVKGDEADASMRHFAEQLATAIADPASKSAEAFHNLGISQEALVKTGGDAAAGMKLMADANNAVADSANKTENMNQLLGRGFEKLLPLLQGGSEGMQQMMQKAIDLGITMDEKTATSLEKTGQKAEELSAVIKGQAIAAFVAWGPQIQGIIGLLEDLGRTTGYVTKIIGGLVNAIRDMNIGGGVGGGGGFNPAGMLGYLPGMQALKPFLPSMFGDPKKALPDTAGSIGASNRFVNQADALPLVKSNNVNPLEAMRKRMDDAAFAAGQGVTGAKGGISGSAARAQAEGAAELAVMQKTLAEEKLTAEQRAQLEAMISAKKLSLYNEGASAQEAAARRGAAAAAKAAKQSYADFAEGEKLKISEANGSSAAILAIYNEWKAAATTIYRQQASEVEKIEREKINAVNKARLDEIRSGAQEEMLINRARLVMSKADMPLPGTPQVAGKATAQTISSSEQEAAAIEASAEQEVAALMQVMQTSEKGSQVQKEAANEILRVVTEAKSQEISLYQKAADAAREAQAKMLKPFTDMFNSMGSQFESLTSSFVKAIFAPQVDLIKQGLTTIKINERNTEVHQALQKFALDMVQDAAKSLETAASNSIGNLLSNALNIPMQAGMSGISGLIGSGLSKLVGSTFGGASGALGSAAGSAASSTAMTSAITAAITAQTASTTAAQTASASTIVASQAAGTASVVAAITSAAATEDALLTANAAKPTIAGFSFAGGGIVPSAAGGMVSGGTGATLAILHAKEMVLPAHLSTGIQGMINSGNRSANANLNYSPTINTASRGRQGTGMSRSEFTQMMTQHGGSMMGEARNMMRNGFRPG